MVVQELQVVQCMNRGIFITTMLIVLGQTIYAQTYYYRFTKSIIKGKPDTNVNGGQFITFDGRKCFESDKYGNNVGNGSMSYDKENSSQLETYWGACYWSKNAYMKFNADRSTMNIETNAGKIYVYKRAAAPAGVTTCSLIRKPEPSQNGGGGGSGYTPSYPTQPTYPNSGYAGGGTSGNSGYSGSTGGNTYNPSRDQPQKTRHICPGCNGARTIVRNDGSISSYGNSGYMKRCNTCGAEYWSTTFHRHVTCSICHGKGYQEY